MIHNISITSDHAIPLEILWKRSHQANTLAFIDAYFSNKTPALTRCFLLK